MEVYLQTQLSLRAALQLGIQGVHQFRVQCTHRQTEIGFSAQRWAHANRYQTKCSGLLDVRHRATHTMTDLKPRRMLQAHREDVLVGGNFRSVALSATISLDSNASSDGIRGGCLRRQAGQERMKRLGQFSSQG